MNMIQGCKRHSSACVTKQSIAYQVQHPLQVQYKCQRKIHQRQNIVVRAEAESTSDKNEYVEQIKAMLELVDKTDIVHVEIDSTAWRISAKKQEAIDKPVAMQVQAPAQVPMQVQQPVEPAAPPPPPPPAAPAAEAEPAAPVQSASSQVEGLEVLSPMAGTYYSSPGPGEPAFVQVGDSVTVGQTVCIVEAMKLMNSIESEYAGKVIKILVKNQEAVSPGQPIMIVG